MLRLILICILICIILTGLAFTQIPQTMSYQGILTDNEGNLVVDGTVSITFKLYDFAEQGTALWEETQDVTTSNGLFNVTDRPKI